MACRTSLRLLRQIIGSTVVKLLLNKGAAVDSKDERPLWEAAKNWHETVVKLLKLRDALSL
jgi:hypothetical protein